MSREKYKERRTGIPPHCKQMGYPARNFMKTFKIHEVFIPNALQNSLPIRVAYKIFEEGQWVIRPDGIGTCEVRISKAELDGKTNDEKMEYIKKSIRDDMDKMVEGAEELQTLKWMEGYEFDHKDIGNDKKVESPRKEREIPAKQIPRKT